MGINQKHLKQFLHHNCLVLVLLLLSLYSYRKALCRVCFDNRSYFVFPQLMFWLVPGIPRQRPATPALLLREGGVAPGCLHNNHEGRAPPLPPPTPPCPQVTPYAVLQGPLQDPVPLALGGVVGWQPGSGKVGGSPVESQVTAGPGSRPKIWCRRSAVRPRQPARHNLRLDLLPCHHSHLSLDKKSFKEVQVEQERSSEEEAAKELPPRSLRPMLSRRQPLFSPASS